jgi:hypothetical protein
MDSLEIYEAGEIVAVYCSACAEGVEVASHETATWLEADDRDIDTVCDDCGITIEASSSNPVDWYAHRGVK